MVPTGDRRTFLRAVALTAGAGLLSGCELAELGGEPAASPLPSPADGGTGGGIGEEPQLWRLAAGRGLLFGSQARDEDLRADSAYAELVRTQGAMLTTSDLTWAVVRRPRLADFDFTAADFMVDFAERAAMLVRAQSLVWDRSFARGVEDEIRASGRVEALMVDHVTHVVSRYAGRMHSWAVVNEAIAPDQGHPDGLRSESVWFEALGPEYIDTAFHAAAAADQQGLLYYNDFALETGREGAHTAEEKQVAVLRLLEGLRSRGVPIDALGVQAHLNSRAMREGFDEERYRAFLGQVAGLGLRLIVTEMTVTDRDEDGDVAARDQAVADAYEQYLTTTLDEAAVIGVGTFGLADRYSRLREQSAERLEGQRGGDRQRASEDTIGERDDAELVRPMPFDVDLRPKAARDAIARALIGAPARDLSDSSRLRLPRSLEGPNPG